MFIVELDKPINDTISTKSGIELYINTDYEGGEFKYRVMTGQL